MKKLETYIFSTLLLLISVTTVITSCQKDGKQGTPEIKNVFYDEKTKTNFNLDDQVELNRFVLSRINEPSGVEIIESAVFTELQDSRGTYQAISVKYKTGKLVTRMVVPLIKLEGQGRTASTGSGTENAMYYASCDMKCTSAWGCSECNQKIVERCKEQTCSCTGGSGGCSSKITFLD